MADYDPELESLVRELNASKSGAAAKASAAGAGAAAGPRAVAPMPVAAPVSAKPKVVSSLEQLLEYAKNRGASDVLLVAGSGLILRIDGALVQNKSPVFSEEEIRALALPLLTPQRADELERERFADFSFVHPGIGRFRTNLHYQKGTLAVAIRILPAEIPTLEALHLPAALARLTQRKQGLVLVTGPTGSGKTSTLAALLNLVNRQSAYHVVTIEDPIEYHHPNQRSVFEQIEIGHDANSFAASLRSVLRQSPDVILVGEMRDPDTMAAVLTAAETGHLVFSTLHTNDAIQAVNRIVDSFPAGRQNQIRQQLSLALAAIVAQQLVPAADGNGRYPAVEVLIANDAVRHIIRKGEDHLLRSQLSIGRTDGMMLMEQSLAELVQRGRIDREMAAAHCFRSDDLGRYLET